MDLLIGTGKLTNGAQAILARDSIAGGGSSSPPERRIVIETLTELNSKTKYLIAGCAPYLGVHRDLSSRVAISAIFKPQLHWQYGKSTTENMGVITTETSQLFEVKRAPGYGEISLHFKI